jgi:DNA adenine methylase
MKIKSMTPHFGCKRTLAPQIVAEFGPHRAYWEPFCGSAAVLFAKPKSSAETICDLHLGVTAIARVLQDDAQTERLYARMARTFSCDAVYQDALAAVVASPSDPEDLVDYAANYLIVSWQGRNGTAGLKLSDKSPRPARRWSSGGGNTATRWRSVVDSIPDWVDRLRGVNVLQEDGLAALSKIRDEAGTVIYCDPPYVEK